MVHKIRLPSRMKDLTFGREGADNSVLYIDQAHFIPQRKKGWDEYYKLDSNAKKFVLDSIKRGRGMYSFKMTDGGFKKTKKKQIFFRALRNGYLTGFHGWFNRKGELVTIG